MRLTWNDSARQLDIGARQGAFPGMLPGQALTIVCGAGQAKQAAVSVAYTGVAQSVKLPNCR